MGSHVIVLVDLLFGDLGVSEQTFLFTVISTHLIVGGRVGMLGGVVGFNEEPVDKASYGPSHHGGYDRHPPPVTNTALGAPAELELHKTLNNRLHVGIPVNNYVCK